MMAIRGIYENNTSAVVEPWHRLQYRCHRADPAHLRRVAGAQGQDLPQLTLNPHPTLIPAIESGWVQSVCFGTELGMEDYIAQRPDVFFTGRDGSLRSTA